MYMESNRNTDGVTEGYVVALKERDAESSRSRRRCNDETPERTIGAACNASNVGGM